ncbi:rna-directed dna polymerase from mobile element jockey-like protein [Lasius niger]|uniref:Rna-directed dna polymerase from mobile element jockey-like protein n=1 Tax=Lasius niger TaxID=67767 RepID=A0A0J7KAT3_LASNI|nr:rna-directed dna polymerase from mobile element jockey-like protein [Lasius niger]
MDDVKTSWQKIRTNIMGAAEEALGKRKSSSNGRRNNTPWFRKEVRTLAEKKRYAYLQYRSKTITYREYKEVRNRVNEAIRQIKRDFWEKFSADMEYDLYGAQKRVWNMLRNRRKHVNELVQTTRITTDEWEKHFMELYKDDTGREETDNACEEEEEEARTPLLTRMTTLLTPKKYKGQ